MLKVVFFCYDGITACLRNKTVAKKESKYSFSMRQ